MARGKPKHARKRKGDGTQLNDMPMADVEREKKQAELERAADHLLRGGKLESLGVTSIELIDGKTGEVTDLTPGLTGKAKRGTSRKVGDKAPLHAPVTKRLYESVLPVKLTEAELRERSRALANSVTEIDKVEAEKKASADKFKATLDRWYGVQGSLSRQVDSGEDYRPVPCREVHDYEQGLVFEYRNDTNTMLSKREMSEQEKQLGFDLDKAS